MDPQHCIAEYLVFQWTFSANDKNIGTSEDKKTFLKGRTPGLLLNFVKFPCTWNRFHIPNMDLDPDPDPDPDPGQPNEFGSIRFRIHKTRNNYQKNQISNIKNYGTHLGVLGSSMIPDGLFLRLVG
jgi:hypothetical protein